MKRTFVVAVFVVAALLLVMRWLSNQPVNVNISTPVRSSAIDASVRRTQVFTLADGLTAYRLTPYYTTTIGGIDWVAWIENLPFGQYGRELPYHPGFHYVTVAPTAEISPTGRWDMIDAVMSREVTETVSWTSDAITPTGWITAETGLSPTIIISLPTWAGAGTITTSMVLTHVIGSAPVDGVISVTKYISQSGHVVPGTISATLRMMFEVQDDARGLVLNYQGLTGTFTIAAEQDPVFYSAAAFVGDYGRAQFQVQARTTATDTAIVWWTQFAPAVNGSCAGATAWSDGAASSRAYRDPDRGFYIWQPLDVLVRTVGADAMGFQMAVRNDCARVAFTGPAGVVFTPTIYLRPY